MYRTAIGNTNTNTPLARPNFDRFAFCTGCDRADSKQGNETEREEGVVALRIDRRQRGHGVVGFDLLADEVTHLERI